ncbi:MAG: DUF1501 domain-containing protein [Roseimicrobium sp.]
MPSFTRRALLTKLAIAAAPTIEDAGRHTLVVVFLRGGADTLNLVVPYADDGYYRARPTLAIKPPGSDGNSSRALRLDDHYALHPMLEPLRQKFFEGRLSIVQAVGTDNSTGSHFECQDQMEHGDAMTGPPAGGGWLGRFLRARASAKLGPLSAVAIGTTLPESLRGAPVASVMQSLDEIAMRTPSGKPEAAAAVLAALYGADVTMLGEQGRETLDLFKRVTELQRGSYTPSNGAQYPKDSFGDGMREIARLIKADVGLEVACIDLGGWDTHFFQGTTESFHAGRAKILGDGLAAFDADLKEHRARFTVMVTTEFGRRIYENASLGTDHGRGFALMTLSNRIKGGRILGQWPSVVENESPAGPGGMKIEHDYRSVFAEVLRGAMGLRNPGAVFPGFTPAKVGLV